MDDFFADGINQMLNAGRGAPNDAKIVYAKPEMVAYGWFGVVGDAGTSTEAEVEECLGMGGDP